jgi:hypothetical protein
MTNHAEIVERLKGIATTDHERGCEGRNYACSCGWDEENMEIGNQAAALIEAQAERVRELEGALDVATDYVNELVARQARKDQDNG